jgi:hypothetical protein
MGPSTRAISGRGCSAPLPAHQPLSGGRPVVHLAGPGRSGDGSREGGSVTDAEYEAQRVRIRALIDRWVDALGLKWWHLDFAYTRDSGDFEVNGNPAPQAVACCAADWRYGTATVSWNMPAVARQDDDKLEMIFVHELMHIFLNEFRRLLPEDGKLDLVGRDDWLAHEERVASTLARAFLWLRDDMTKEPAHA